MATIGLERYNEYVKVKGWYVVKMPLGEWQMRQLCDEGETK